MSNEESEIEELTKGSGKDAVANEAGDSNETNTVLISHPIADYTIDSVGIAAHLDFNKKEASCRDSDNLPSDLIPGIQQKYLNTVHN